MWYNIPTMKRNIKPPTPENIGGYILNDEQFTGEYIEPALLEALRTNPEGNISEIIYTQSGKLALELLRFDYIEGSPKDGLFNVVTIVNDPNRT
jgi:hypothetical protein